MTPYLTLPSTSGQERSINQALKVSRYSNLLIYIDDVLNNILLKIADISLTSVSHLRYLQFLVSFNPKHWQV